MIKAINITPLNTSNKLYCKCEYCGFETEIILLNSIVNTSNDGKIIKSEFEEVECFKCKKIIKEN